MPNKLLTEALDLISTKTVEDDRDSGYPFHTLRILMAAGYAMRASVSAGYTSSGWTHGNWFCGFWIGLLLVRYLHTKRRGSFDLAIERMRLIAHAQPIPIPADIGFIFWSSAVPHTGSAEKMDC
jgi:unsaturated chondroitin disaccharide hydrolase